MPDHPSAPGLDAALASPARLAAVADTGLVDAPAEEAFDTMTRLAASVLNVPASFITLVDANRDFYLSQSGFAEPLASQRQLQGRTFCHYTLERGDALVITDTHADPEWRGVPTVESLGVRAYVGVPLQFEGQNIGSLCAIDVQPRQWSAQEVGILRQLALSAARELALRRALHVAEGESEKSRSQARSREEVLAVVAHDLRTPLQILHLGTAVLQRSPRSESEDKLLVRMAGAVKAMSDMAEVLLADAAADSQDARREDIPAARLATDAVEMMRPIAQRSKVVLGLGELTGADVNVNYGQLLRVFGNVLGNAIKFSPPGGTVHVAARAENDFVMFSVSDEGAGISADAAAHAFDSGWQGDAGMMHGGGAGLGLAIVRRLIERHGGTAAIRALPEGGTAVTFSVPVGAGRH